MSLEQDQAEIALRNNNTITPRGIGLHFQEPEDVRLLDTPITPIATVTHGPDTYYLARFSTTFTADGFYNLLTAVKPHPASQVKRGAVADWANPFFVENHKELHPAKWDELNKNLPFLTEFMTEDTVDTYWNYAADHISGPEFFEYKANPDKPVEGNAQGYKYRKGYIINHMLANPSLGFLLDTFSKYVHTNGYREMSTLLEWLEISSFIPPKPDNPLMFGNGSFVIARDRSQKLERWTTTAQMNKINSLLIRSRQENEATIRIEQTMKTLAHNFILSLGKEPTDRALKLLHIAVQGIPLGYSKQKFFDEPLDETTVSADWGTSVLYRTFSKTDGTIISSDEYPSMQYSLDNNKSWWFHDAGVNLGRTVSPILCWSNDGHERKYIYDMEEVSTLFKDKIFHSPTGKGSDNSFVGYMGLAYLTPQVRSFFRHTMGLPKVKDDKTNKMTGPDNEQDMQEGQVPLLAMYFDKYFLQRGTVLPALESKFTSE